MKRISIYFVMSLAAVFMAGCMEEADIRYEEVHFNAVTDQEVTRTELGEDLSVLWQESDEISIFSGTSYNNQFVLNTGAGTTEASFTTGQFYYDYDYDLNYAVYPYSEDNQLYDGNTVALNINWLQPYKEGGFDSGMNPMIAVSDIDDFTLRFRNVCGMLKVSVTGDKKISYAALLGVNDEPLAGPCRVDVNDMTVTFGADAETAVYLYCGDGVQLDPVEPTDFLFVVPPVMFEDGFGVYLNDIDGGSMLCYRYKPTEIKRNKVLSMSTIAYVPDDQGDDDDDNGDGGDDEWKGVVETGWESKDFHHRSVAMRFTADWCGYCPMMAEAFAIAKERLSGNLEVLSMHADGGLYFAPCLDLFSYYGFTGFPTGTVDGRAVVHNNDVETTAEFTLRKVEETESLYETVSAVSWVSEINGDEARVDVAAYLKKAGSYKITALAVEDNIVAWQNGAGNAYVHNGVPRMAFTSIWGEDITASEDNQVVKLTYKEEIPSGCDTGNMRIVVYIQEYNRGAGIVDDYYINNSATGRLGGSVTLAESVEGSGGTEDIGQGDDIEM